MQKYISLLSQISGISGSCFSTASKVDSSRAANCPELEAGSDGKHSVLLNLLLFDAVQSNSVCVSAFIYVCVCVWTRMEVSLRSALLRRKIYAQKLMEMRWRNDQKINIQTNKNPREFKERLQNFFNFSFLTYHQDRQFSSDSLLIINENINSRCTADTEFFHGLSRKTILPHICVPFLT